jgi:hypothetical protein
MDTIKYCKRCNRVLKSQESRERGYGKTCWEKAQKNIKPLFNLNEKSS